MTNSRRFVAVTFAGYAVLTLWLALHHEPWCDEADSWLLMRDGGVTTMLSRTGYAGTPALWYLAIAPFAAAGLPYTAQALLNLAFAWGAALLLLLYAPFPRVVKVLFLFSYYMAFEYSVLARPYALMVLLLFGIAASWESRQGHPWRFAALVALLANTTSHGLIIAAAIALAAVRGRAIVVAAAGLALAALQLRVPVDGPRIVRYIDPQSIPYAIGSAFLPGVDLRTSFAIGVCVFIAVIAAVHRDRRALLVLVAGTSALLILFVFVWLGGLRHAGLLLVLIFTALWVAKTRGELIAHVALAATLAWSIVPAAQNWIADTKYAYSGGKDMGRYIAAHNLQRFEIVAHPPNETKSVAVFLPGKRFWFGATGRYGTYSTWDRRFDQEQATSVHTAIRNAESQFRGKPWLLLTNAPVRGANLTLLYENRQHIYARPTERFYLYRCEF